MKKIIVQTKALESGGKAGYIEPNTGQVISSRRPTVVTNTGFVSELISNGSLELLAPNLPPEANDDDFAATLVESDGDVELAVASYVSNFEKKD